MNTSLLNITVNWSWQISDDGLIHELLVFVDGDPFEHGHALVHLDAARLAALDDDERDEELTPGWCLRIVSGDHALSHKPSAPQWRRSPDRCLTYLFCNPSNWWPYVHQKDAPLGIEQPLATPRDLHSLILREFEARFAQLSGNTTPLDLQRLDAALARKRGELADLQRECEQLREQRRRLIRSLEGQLDLFRDQMAQSEQLLNEVRHG